MTWNVEGAALIGAYMLIFSGVGWVTGGFGGAVSRWAGRLYGEGTDVGDAERHAQRAPLFGRSRRHATQPTNAQIVERLARRNRTGGPTVAETVAEIRRTREPRDRH